MTGRLAARRPPNNRAPDRGGPCGYPVFPFGTGVVSRFLFAEVAPDDIPSGVPEIDRDMCRKAAAECVELARATNDPAKKEILLIRAQEWLKLAYSRSEEEFERHLSQLNNEKMGGSVQRTSMQQQPRQQQQQRRSEEDE